MTNALDRPGGDDRSAGLRCLGTLHRAARASWRGKQLAGGAAHRPLSRRGGPGAPGRMMIRSGAPAPDGGAARCKRRPCGGRWSAGAAPPVPHSPASLGGAPLLSTAMLGNGCNRFRPYGRVKADIPRRSTWATLNSEVRPFPCGCGVLPRTRAVWFRPAGSPSGLPTWSRPPSSMRRMMPSGSSSSPFRFRTGAPGGDPGDHLRSISRLEAVSDPQAFFRQRGRPGDLRAAIQLAPLLTSARGLGLSSWLGACSGRQITCAPGGRMRGTGSASPVRACWNTRISCSSGR